MTLTVLITETLANKRVGEWRFKFIFAKYINLNFKHCQYGNMSNHVIYGVSRLCTQCIFVKKFGNFTFLRMLKASTRI